MRASMWNGLNSLLFLVLLLCLAHPAGAGEWELLYDNGGIPFEAAPSITGGTVFLVDLKGDIAALKEGGASVENPFDGEEDISLSATGFGVLWKLSLGESVGAAPVVGRDGILYVLTEGCTLYAVNRNNGSVNWEMPVAPGERCPNTPAVSRNNTVYVVTAEGEVRAVNGQRLLWSGSMGEKVLFSPALGPDETLFVGDAGGSLNVVRNGSVACSFQAGSAITGQPALLGDDTVVFSTLNGMMYAVSTGDCGLQWSFDLGAGADDTQVVDADGRIYYTKGDLLGSIDRNGLGHRTVAGGEDSVNGSPLVTKDGVWIQDRTGNLYRSTGGDAELITGGFAGDEKFYAFPGVDSEGKVYAAAYSGKLYRTAAAPLDLLSPWPSWGQYSENRSGDWPRLFTTTSSLGLNCNDSTATVSDTLSFTNGGPGILRWRAELSGVVGTVVPEEGELSPWNWVYPRVTVEEECGAVDDNAGTVTLTDQFGVSTVIPLTVLKNPICLSGNRLDVPSCEKVIAGSFTMESCTGREFTYRVSGPSWVDIENPEGAVEGSGVEEIMLTINAFENMDPNPEGEILISGTEGDLKWRRTLPIRVICGDPVVKLNTFDGTAIAGINAAEETISILSRDRCTLMDSDSGESLLHVDRSDRFINYIELDWRKELIDDGRTFKPGSFSYSAPLFADNKLYVPCSDDFLRAYSIPERSDLKDGDRSELEWEYDTEGLLYGPPVKGGEDDDFIYTVSADGLLSCIKDKNGKKEWDEEFDDLEQFNEHLISNDQGGTYNGVTTAVDSDGKELMIVTSRARNIMAFDAEEGDFRYGYAAESLLGTPPVPYGEAPGQNLVFGTWSGYVGILSSDFELEDRCDVGGPVSGTLFIDNNTIYAGNTEGVLTAVDIVTGGDASGSSLKCRKSWQTDLATGPGAGDEDTLWAIHPLKKTGLDLWVMVSPMEGESPARLLQINILDGSVVKLAHEFDEGERIVGVPDTSGERTFFLTLDSSGEQGTLYRSFPTEISPATLEVSVIPEDFNMCPKERLTIDATVYQEQGDILLVVAGQPLITIPADEVPLGERFEVFAMPNLEGIEGILGDWELSVESAVNKNAFTLTVVESCE